MDYRFELKGLNKLLAKLEAATRQEVLLGSLTKGAALVTGWIKRNRLTGPRPDVLGVRSGRLRSSISFSQAEKSGNEYRARIGTNVIYARIHEYGGVIYPKKGKFLRFKTVDNRWHSVKSVTIPARPFMKPALENKDNTDGILNILTQSINKAINDSK